VPNTLNFTNVNNYTLSGQNAGDIKGMMVDGGDGDAAAFMDDFTHDSTNSYNLKTDDAPFNVITGTSDTYPSKVQEDNITGYFFSNIAQDAAVVLKNGSYSSDLSQVNIHNSAVGFSGMFNTNLNKLVGAMLLVRAPAAGAPVADPCDCPVSGNFEISDGNICNITTACDIGTNKFRTNANSGYNILSGGSVDAGGCYCDLDALNCFTAEISNGLFCGTS